MFNIGLYSENMKNLFLSETTRHHLVDFYQVCSNYAPRAKTWIQQKNHCLRADKFVYIMPLGPIWVLSWGQMIDKCSYEINLSETIRTKPFIFCM